MNRGKNNSANNNLQPNGYQETIQKGVASLWNFKSLFRISACADGEARFFAR